MYRMHRLYKNSVKMAGREGGSCVILHPGTAVEVGGSLVISCIHRLYLKSEPRIARLGEREREFICQTNLR